MFNSISVVIPALNEEDNIIKTVQTVISVISRRFPDYELLIYDDGSTDQTGWIVDELSKKNPSIKVIHHTQNRGLGACYREGARIAAKELYLLVHGDNEIAPQTIQDIIHKAETAEIVVPYIQNPNVRPFTRRIISRSYTLLTNFLFGLKLPYYNGPCLVRTSLVKHLPIENDGFGFMMETLVRLVQSGHSYVTVGFNCRLREKGKTKAFRIKNVLSVVGGMIRFRLNGS